MNRVDNRVARVPTEPGSVFLFKNNPLTGLAGIAGGFPFPRLAGHYAQRGEQSRRSCLRAFYPVIPVKSVKCKRDIGKVATGLNRLNRVRASRVSLGSWTGAQFVASETSKPVFCVPSKRSPCTCDLIA